MTRAAVYLRISQDATGEQAGVTRQREDCQALVTAQGWDLFETYVDNDISASSGRARPEYLRMLADIKAGHIDAIVAWHPDRLYRKLTDLEGLIAAVESRNVIMRTVRAGEIDLSTPTGRMLARILSATAQAEGEVKADRWKRSWRQGREAGRPAKTGSRLFGYTHEGELIPEEADIARRMAKDVLAGVGILGVSRWLQDEGITTTRGGVWRPGTVRQYLANPRIAGWSTLNGEIIAEGTWEPLIDRDTWETVRAMLQARARDNPVRVSLLNGVLFCGVCGVRMVTSGSKGKRTYRCPKRPGFDGCGGVSAFAEPVEEVVEGYAEARLRDPAVLARMAELRSSAGAVDLVAEIQGLEARLLELEAQLDTPGVPVATIMRAMDRARERLGQAQRDLAEAATNDQPVNTGGAEWPTTLAERRRLVEIALGDERVYLDPHKGGPRFLPERVRVASVGDGLDRRSGE